MLVLTRREGESLLIGNDLRITVLIVYETKTKLRIQDSEDKTTMMRKNTTITLREGITVTVADIDQHQVKLGIKAPKHVNIEREASITGTNKYRKH